MINNELDVRAAQVTAVAHAMMTAARTAPKACGRDHLTIIAVTGDDLRALADEMRRYGTRRGLAFFDRDAANVEQAQALVVIGTTYATFGLNCGFCGFATCAEKDGAIPCAFNTNDLGIALGSAVGLAADNRVDSRIMYSAGRSAQDLGWLGDCRASIAIALSCSGKSPFFDRK